MRGASGRTGLLLVVAVLASGEHPKPQPSLDVTCCGLGTWRIDTVPSWYRHCHLLLPKSDFMELCKVLGTHRITTAIRSSLSTGTFNASFCCPRVTLRSCARCWWRRSVLNAITVTSLKFDPLWLRHVDNRYIAYSTARRLFLSARTFNACSCCFIVTWWSCARCWWRRR